MKINLESITKNTGIGLLSLIIGFGNIGCFLKNKSYEGKLTGKTVFSARDNAEGDFEIYIMDLATKKIIQLTYNNVDDIDPQMSPDGSQTTYSSKVGGKNYQVCLINSDGTNKRILTNDNFDHIKPSFLPDGSGIDYFTSGGKSGEKYSKFETDLEGKSKTKLIELDRNNLYKFCPRCKCAEQEGKELIPEEDIEE